MQEKYKGAFSYLLFLAGPLVVLYGFKDNTRLTKIHAAQGLLIHISIIIASVLIFFPIVGCIAMVYPIIASILMIIGAIKGFSEEEFVVPGLTDWAMSMFKSVIDNDNTKKENEVSTESSVESNTASNTESNSEDNIEDNAEDDTENNTENSDENNDENK